MPDLWEKNVVPTDYIKVKRKVKEIPDIRSFNDLLEASTLSDEDKEIIRLHYLKDKDFGFIADKLGYTDVTVKAKHRKAIMKLSKLL